MPLASIDDLRSRWRANGTLDAAEQALAVIGFDDAYVDAAVGGPRSSGSKVIKDAVWGMIEVDASTLRLLDCPIVQRLRAIHQLGFSFLTYPSAEHSRFAHSLGMYGVVSRFLDLITERGETKKVSSDKYQEWSPNPDQTRLARHAAILHDIGHMPFSHVTEQILQARPTEFACGPLQLDDFLIDPEELVRNRKLAELLSVAVVLSDRFGRFYSGHVAPDAKENDTLRIASLILGRAVEPEYEGIANLISGDSIDADKIDYINRDALACGIAVGIDVSRLFLRSRFLSVKPWYIKQIKELDYLPQNDQVVFVVNASGLDSIEEIGQARTMLFHRVYLHQTTRNAERLLGKALEAELVDPSELQPPLRDAFGLWTYDDFELLKRLSASPKPSGELARRLRTRRLPKRASAFGRRYVHMLVPVRELFPKMTTKDVGTLVKEGVGGGLEDFRSPALSGAKLTELEDKIANEAMALADKLRTAEYHAPEGRPVVSVLPLTNIQQDREDTYVLEGDDLILTASTSVADEQMDAADIMKSAGYVLTDPAWRTVVFLAARSVIYRHGQRERQVALSPYPGSSHTVSFSSRILIDERQVAQRVRMTGDDLDNTFRRAAAVGYFDEAPRLAPVELDENTMSAAAHRLQEFTGQGDWRVTNQTVRAFLSQFPVTLREEGLKLVYGFSIFGKARLAQSLRAGIERIPLGARRGYVTSLSPDSGGYVRTTLEHELSAQISTKGWTFKKTIRDVFREAEKGDTLVLCDDNVTSGSQALCQILAWLGVPETEWTEEQRQERGIEKSPLDPRDAEIFRAMNIAIVVDTGTNDADQNLRAELSKLGVTSFLGVKFDHPLELEKVQLSDAMHQFLDDAGASVLRWCRHQKKLASEITPEQEEACRRDALGYRGARATMATQLSVPVGTLTAFWAPGYVRGEPWFPLLLRRGYIGSLVLS